MHARTRRLDLDVPVDTDVDGLYVLCRDPRVWEHYPTLRHVDSIVTSQMIEEWMLQWDRDGLGTWVVRSLSSPKIIGYGGCSVRRELFWNLGYRFLPDVQGRGFATEVSIAALDHARRVRPDMPVVAYLLEHNAASARVAEKVGLTLVERAPDQGNPDSHAIRLVYSDRDLSDVELKGVLDR